MLGVTGMKHVKDMISVDTHRIRCAQFTWSLVIGSARFEGNISAVVSTGADYEVFIGCSWLFGVRFVPGLLWFTFTFFVGVSKRLLVRSLPRGHYQ